METGLLEINTVFLALPEIQSLKKQQQRQQKQNLAPVNKSVLRVAPARRTIHSKLFFIFYGKMEKC